jgi:uncharacterized LabA/DUF88 family protein
MDSTDHQKSLRLAVLIDAENANASLIEPLLKEIAKYGTAHVKRIYGDWTKPQLNNWKVKLHKFAIQPIQQFRYTTGKNSTDSALIIDAMDLLYTRNFDGFCIVSSDSDFTRLASRIRESGLVVYGFGERKTPTAFVSTCDKFVFTEVLTQPEEIKGVQVTTATPSHPMKSAPSDAEIDLVNTIDKRNLKLINKVLIKLLKDAYDAVDEADGWSDLSALGSHLQKLSPSFDPRNYGYKKLSELIQAVEIFEIKTVKRSGNHIQLLCKLK